MSCVSPCGFEDSQSLGPQLSQGHNSQGSSSSLTCAWPFLLLLLPKYRWYAAGGERAGGEVGLGGRNWRVHGTGGVPTACASHPFRHRDVRLRLVSRGLSTTHVDLWVLCAGQRAGQRVQDFHSPVCFDGDGLLCRLCSRATLRPRLAVVRTATRTHTLRPTCKSATTCQFG